MCCLNKMYCKLTMCVYFIKKCVCMFFSTLTLKLKRCGINFNPKQGGSLC